ncbi:hypothetical protein L9F63_000668 [Diploptera punctata]|uniref:Uncharacterized protein n=1 Tax=Diploptera punctata TaxID=6984 RepID=A0AAD8AM21_DIPPU|nr:hypothetical protein L9F63_000668 [Diploptera punctata]
MIIYISWKIVKINSNKILCFRLVLLATCNAGVVQWVGNLTSSVVSSEQHDFPPDFVLGFHQHVLPGEAVLNMQPEEPGGLDVILEAEELHGTCDCWNTTEDGRDVEVECRCGGEELVDIPHNMAADVHRM